MTNPVVNVKSFERRGDFAFRDVYRRNGFATFAPQALGEESSYAVDAEGAAPAVHCAAHITKYDSGNGVASYHLFTRNNADFDKTLTSQATLSVDPASVVIRAANSTCQGSFTVGAQAFRVDAATRRAGINTPASPAYTLDVGGDCNLSGNLRVRGNAVVQAGAGPQGNLVLATLDGLTLRGPLDAGGNVLTVNVATQRVGVNVGGDPAHALDVAGDANLGLGGTYRVQGTAVLSRTTLGSSVTASSLTSVGNLTSLTVAPGGATRLDSCLFRSINRGLAQPLGSATEVCQLQAGHGGYFVSMGVVQTHEHNSLSRMYHLPIWFNATMGEWRRALPIASSGPNNEHDWAVDVRVLESTATLRLVRTQTTPLASNVNITSSLAVYQSANQVTLTELSATAANVSLSLEPYVGTPLTQVGGNVGIGTAAPTTKLEVAGSVSVSGNLRVGGYELASSVMYQSAQPFVYTGPGVALDNGVPFFQAVQTRGTPFVTPSGNNNSVFTFTAGGTYMVQAEVEGGYPWLPEGDVITYFVKNGNAAQKLGYECQPVGATFGCTRSYLLVADAQDTVRFVVDSSTAGPDFQVGIQACRITFAKW